MAMKKELIARLAGKKAEPEAEAVKDKLSLVKALNVYALEYDKADSYKWLKQYLQKHRPQYAKALDENRLRTTTSLQSLGNQCRLVMRGVDIPELNEAELLARIDELTIDAPKQVTVKVKFPQPNAAIAAVQELEEQIFNDKLKVALTTIPGVTSTYRDEAIRFASTQLEYLERYPWDYKEQQHRPLTKLWKKALDLLKASIPAPKPPKPRQPKPKDPKKLVKGVEFQDKWETHTSIHPSKIIGAKQAVLYDTAKRVIILLEDANGISCRGKSFIASKCEQKIVRKPTDLTTIATHSSFLKYIRDSKSVPRKHSGRTNPNIIILSKR